jgi:hypothetical protein
MASKPKWKRCKNIVDWFCDECRMCSDPECKNCGSEPRPKWMKHLGEDTALCDRCWPGHHGRYEEQDGSPGT